MNGQEAILPSVWFGLDPMAVAATLFIITYIVVMTERVNRAIVAMLAAGLMIISGVIDQKTALQGVDANTLGLLIGMMVIVAITRQSGLFQYLAYWSAKKVRAHPWGILVMLSLVTAVTSALLDNVTTVLLIVPVALVLTEELKVNPAPYLFTLIFSSNIGGTATLIGDPPNIMIGSAVGIGFNAFLYHLGPAVVVVMAATLLPIYLGWGRRLRAKDEDRLRIMEFDERDAITEPRLLAPCLTVIGFVLLGFVFAHPLKLEVATVALTGAAALLLWCNYGRPVTEQARNVHQSFGQVEWVTIFFFIGLFVVVRGVDSTGLLRIIADWVVRVTGGDLPAMAMTVLWVSAILSAIVDNIPFVAAMIPVIKSMGPTFGGSDQLLPLWWSLSLGACLGGNGSLVGASANLVVAGIAERTGNPIRFLRYTLLAFPLMLMSIVICSGYVYWRYLS